MSSLPTHETPATLSFSDQLTQRIINAADLYPQSPYGTIIGLADTAVHNLLKGECTWHEFETFVPNEEQTVEIGETLDHAHRRIGIPIRSQNCCEEGFDGKRISNKRLQGSAAWHRNAAILAIGGYASALASEQLTIGGLPRRRTSKVDARLNLARQLFTDPTMQSGVSAARASERQALGLFIGAIVKSAEPSNPAIRQGIKDTYNFYRSSMRAGGKQSAKAQSAFEERQHSAFISVAATMMNGVNAQLPSIEAALGRPLPEAATRNFVNTVVYSHITGVEQVSAVSGSPAA